MKAIWGTPVVLLGLAIADAASPSSALRGYSIAASERERADEARLVDLPTAAGALEIAGTIGARPHYAGTPADYALAVDMRDRMRAAGLNATLEPFIARVDTPRELVLALAPPAALDASPPRRQGHGSKSGFPIALNLAEVPEPSDPATAARAIGLPFNAGSGDGDVSAPLVFANRGREADYAALAAANVDVRGAVLLVRYGAQFRGRLAERAQARGAAGVIFYNDPQDDGDARGLVYPAGPWRPGTSIERGWVGPNIHIPTLPVSAANAELLLGSLRGTAGPPDWGGSLPVGYPLARGPGRVHLIVKLNRKPTLLWNTIGTIAGVRGDQSVILGAQRDAWVYGVGANGGGVITVLEVARALGSLMGGGWRPQRTIILAGWDGGALGSSGSRAYIEAHRFALPRGCFAYLDADRPVTGPDFETNAVASLAPIVGEISRGVPDPQQPETSIYEHWAAGGNQQPGLPTVPGPVGGSDAENFLLDVGTPVARLRLTGPFAVANSSDDTLRYATQWSDPDFLFHRAAAQLYGTLAMRLADASGAPYGLEAYPGLIRAQLARLTASARAAGLTLDAGPLNSQLARLAATIREASRQSAGEARGEATLSAVRTLDLLLYGVSGDEGLALPDLASAIATHDQAHVDAAVSTASEAVRRATEAAASDQ